MAAGVGEAGGFGDRVERGSGPCDQFLHQRAEDRAQRDSDDDSDRKGPAPDPCDDGEHGSEREHECVRADAADRSEEGVQHAGAVTFDPLLDRDVPRVENRPLVDRGDPGEDRQGSEDAERDVRTPGEGSCRREVAVEVLVVVQPLVLLVRVEVERRRRLLGIWNGHERRLALEKVISRMYERVLRTTPEPAEN
ncbi:MAG: hypothetical protein WA964_12385 [Ilumatobacter sp.]|uniref:hypothetical protein n=1 Tax=Ilumatobacter sp. TaxID=1967498 RepID=UPI003C7503F2